MSSINKKIQAPTTHEGGPSRIQNPEDELRRTLLTCLLWEDAFYENGETTAKRLQRLVPLCDPVEVYKLAVEARSKQNIRHAPLLLVREMARIKTHKSYVSRALSEVIQRPDELTEFLALYWKEGRCPLSAQVKKGLAAAFKKFKPETLSKYNRDGAVKLKDVLFLSHAKPKDEAQALAWENLINGELATPDTWEVSLSAGKDKKETFERLIQENKLGALAFLRNLRKMKEVLVDEKIIREGFKNLDCSRVLPFRFIAAARYAPEFEPELEAALFKSIEGVEKFKGKTIILVDVSGSMDSNLSSKSETARIDAACGVAMIARELCEEVGILSFSDSLVAQPPRRGFALKDAIVSSQPHKGTRLGEAVRAIQNTLTFDRIIVVTDEQSSDPVPAPKGRGYIFNVASYQNGISTNQWTTISGWSDSVLKYILELERSIEC